MATKKGRKVVILLSLIVMAVIAITTWWAWPIWPSLRFWWRFEALGLNAQGLPEFRHRQTRIVMVKLPGGTFWMGAQKKDPNGQNYDSDAMKEEGPVHAVSLSPFLISKYEIRQAEWKKVMGNNPAHFKGDHLPVENITWEDCQEFCRKTGLKLPTEAGWEYACRAGDSGPYAGALDEMGWYLVNSGGKTHPIGQKMPNLFGLYDMHGNVWGWCEDVWYSDFYSKIESSRPNPLCTSDSEVRVIRGGSWSDYGYCRSAYRSGLRPGDCSDLLGLRPCYRLSQ